MWKTLKIAGLVVGVLLALVIVREAFFGYTAYFAIVPGAKLYSDGYPISGWLHKGGKGRAFILTRIANRKHESYWITISDEKGDSIRSCGDWVAPRFPLIAIGDVNPPCLSFVFSESPPPTPETPERKPTFGSRFVEFTADDGSVSKRLGEPSM